MDFSRPHIHQPSVTTVSKIRYIDPREESAYDESHSTLDKMVVQAANQAAADLFLGNGGDMTAVNSELYPDRTTPQTDIIHANELVVIFESFDNLNFCYARPGEVFSNRNGHFHHDDFIGKPYGCKVRSRNNKGYGYTYLLKPTPELWARSLKHRTQIVHELDASMIVFYLHLRPNMLVCESGTGSGALSHCILRTIAPKGHLHTYEFNEMRANTARQEFAKNGVEKLVTVHHKDVCGKSAPGGFDLDGATADAIILDLPEPWLAVPHAAFTLKPNARIASYSPCVEQSQRTVIAMKECGFHSIKTLEFRLREHYMAEEEYEYVSRAKRPRVTPNPHLVGNAPVTTPTPDTDEAKEDSTGGKDSTKDGANTTEKDAAEKTTTENDDETTGKRKHSVLVARPFGMMRGHTAFLTFATAGNAKRANPNEKLETK
eukprot:Nitzschia sp. Nitz4//scaffold211_size37880//25510//26884//NITZ4_007711-RA/size37880-augustus-gene-0.61-mRNA-1//-1//CDS//3329541994//3038//frame0